MYKFLTKFDSIKKHVPTYVFIHTYEYTYPFYRPHLLKYFPFYSISVQKLRQNVPVFRMNNQAHAPLVLHFKPSNIPTKTRIDSSVYWRYVNIKESRTCSNLPVNQWLSQLSKSTLFPASISSRGRIN